VRVRLAGCAVLLLAAAACGGDEGEGEGGGLSSASSTTSTTSTNGATPTTDTPGTASTPSTTEIAGTSETTGPGTGSPSGDDDPTVMPSTTEDIVTSPTVRTEFGDTEAVAEGTTTTTTEVPWDGLTMPLTGEPAPTGLPERPALVVKVGNNDGRSLPQVGLEVADIVYEVMVENYVTRFIAVYHSELPEAVRPVRSARSSDIDLLANLDRPIFAYWGSNAGVAEEVGEAERLGLLQARSTMGRGQEHFHRDDSRKAPYNGVLDPVSVVNSLDGLTPAPGPIISYGPVPASAVRTFGVRWTTANRDIAFVWDTGSERWIRYQDGVLHFDANGVPLAADNVLKLTVGYRRSDADSISPQLLSVGSGDGWLFRDGTVTGIVWSRQFIADGWTILDDDTGQLLHLDQGSTWVLMARLGEGEILDAREARALTG
jgi:hypothetical protein